MDKIEIVFSAVDQTKGANASVRAELSKTDEKFKQFSAEAKKRADSWRGLQQQKAQAYAQFSQSMTRYTSSVMSLEKQKADAAKDAAKQQQDAWDQTKTSMRNFVIAAVAMGVAVKKAFDMAFEGAQVQRLENSFMQLTEMADVSGKALLEGLTNAAQGAVSRNDMILATNRAMLLGLGADVDKLSQLMEIAAYRGRAMGLSTTQAFNDIVTGIGRQSQLILDNLGFIMRANETYEWYGATIGKAAHELNAAEKQQAFLNRVLELGNAQLKAAGGLAKDTAAEYEILAATTTDLGNAMKEDLAEGILPLVQGFNRMNEESARLNDLYKIGVEASDVFRLNKLLRLEATNELTRAEKEELRNLQDMVARMKELAEGGEFAEKQLRKQAAANREVAETAIAASDALAGQYEGMMGTVSKLQSNHEKYTETIAKHTEKITELKAKQDDVPSWSGKWAQYQKSIEDSEQAIIEAKNAHTEASRQIVFDLLQAKLAADGLSQQEFTGLLTLGQKWGLIAPEIVEEVGKVTAEVYNLEQGIDTMAQRSFDKPVELGTKFAKFGDELFELGMKDSPAMAEAFGVAMGEMTESMVDPREMLVTLNGKVMNLQEMSGKTFTYHFHGIMTGDWPPQNFGGTAGVGDGGGDTCFVKGTSIVMIDGSVKPIEDVQVGDELMGFTDVHTNATVLETFHHITEHYIVINDLLKVTPEHPIRVGQRWLKAGDIQIGDVVFDLDGNVVKVHTLVSKNARVDVYNLSTSCHTYYAEGILVHNKDVRQGGGPVYGGGAYLVGERGPEMFYPKVSGNIVSNARLGKRGKRDRQEQSAGNQVNNIYGPVTLAISRDKAGITGIR